jgi:hypothetical protein
VITPQGIGAEPAPPPPAPPRRPSEQAPAAAAGATAAAAGASAAAAATTPPHTPPSSERAAPPAPSGGGGGQETGPPKRSANRYRARGLGVIALLIIVAVAIVLISSSGGGSSTSSGTPFSATAAPVPTNHVTGSGSATVKLSGDTAVVTLDTNGLLNGSPHAMHIHAGGRGVCPPASAARLHNHSLSISTTDGIKFYGPPQVSLTSAGDTSPKSIIDFSRYPSVGDIRYTRTFTIPTGVADAVRAHNAVIVVHGIDYNHNGIYDNVLDRSELSNALPGEATAPALCGPLSQTTTASAGGTGPSSTTTYAVVLHPTVAAAVAGSAADFALYCHLLAQDAAALTDPRSGGPTAT